MHHNYFQRYDHQQLNHYKQKVYNLQNTVQILQQNNQILVSYIFELNQCYTQKIQIINQMHQDTIQQKLAQQKAIQQQLRFQLDDYWNKMNESEKYKKLVDELQSELNLVKQVNKMLQKQKFELMDSINKLKQSQKQMKIKYIENLFQFEKSNIRYNIDRQSKSILTVSPNLNKSNNSKILSNMLNIEKKSKKYRKEKSKQQSLQLKNEIII